MTVSSIELSQQLSQIPECRVMRSKTQPTRFVVEGLGEFPWFCEPTSDEEDEGIEGGEQSQTSGRFKCARILTREAFDDQVKQVAMLSGIVPKCDQRRGLEIRNGAPWASEYALYPGLKELGVPVPECYGRVNDPRRSCSDQTRLRIFMEKGVDLCNIASSLSNDEWHNIAIQVLQGIECLAKHGLVHRDIKPQNILIHDEAQGRRKVTFIDFENLQKSSTSTVSQLPQVPFINEWHGTSAFFSPSACESFAICRLRRSIPPAQNVVFHQDVFAAALTLLSIRYPSWWKFLLDRGPHAMRTRQNCADFAQRLEEFKNHIQTTQKRELLSTEKVLFDVLASKVPESADTLASEVLQQFIKAVER